MTQAATAMWNGWNGRAWPVRLAVLLALCSALVLGAGCSARQHEPAPLDEPASIERPAAPLEEEQGLTDRIGEVGVVLLVVGVTIALIVIPIMFLSF